MDFKFQRNFSQNDRKIESARVRINHPDKIPVICEINESSQNLSSNYILNHKLIKSKYLVNEDMTIVQFTQVIRGKLKLDKGAALFIIINGRMPSSTQLMSVLYKQYQNEDGFLYIMYCFENVFG